MPKEWSKEEEAFLKQRYGELTNVQLAEVLGVTAKSIEAKLRRLKLKRKGKKFPKKKVEVEKVAISVRPRKDEERQSAIKEFDKAVKLWIEGNTGEAIAAFRKVMVEFRSILDVSNAAKHYLERCKALDRVSQ